MADAGADDDQLAADRGREALRNGEQRGQPADDPTDPKAYTSRGRATVKAQWVPSPSIANGKLILRMKDKVKAWALTP